MFSVIFEVQPRPEHRHTYLAQGRMPSSALEQIDGFVDNIRYASLTRPGWIPSASGWRDERGPRALAHPRPASPDPEPRPLADPARLRPPRGRADPRHASFRTDRRCARSGSTRPSSAPAHGRHPASTARDRGGDWGLAPTRSPAATGPRRLAGLRARPPRAAMSIRHAGRADLPGDLLLLLVLGQGRRPPAEAHEAGGRYSLRNGPDRRACAVAPGWSGGTTAGRSRSTRGTAVLLPEARRCRTHDRLLPR